MNIRWRLGILVLQIGLLLAGAYAVDGRITLSPWFLALLLPLIVNPQLMEPFYPRPVDVIGNSLVAFFIVAALDRSRIEPGWWGYVGGLASASLVAGIALLFGAGRRRGRFTRVARAARQITAVVSSRVIYSGAFWLSLTVTESEFTRPFWILTGLWALLMLLGLVNWQNAWAAATAGPSPAQAEAMVAPSRLVVTAAELPPPGSAVQITAGRTRSDGVVITRIPRPSDLWGEIHVVDANACEALLSARTVEIRTLASPAETIVGSVDIGSTERLLRFVATQPVEVGSVIEVRIPETDLSVMYQISSEVIEAASARGGTQLVVRATAQQIGRRAQQSPRLARYRAVPPPGGPVVRVPTILEVPAAAENDFRVGHISGTKLPVYISLELATEGHLAILGMTKMGKTSLAMRLARALAQTRPVVVLDQTGEYRAKRGLVPMTLEKQWNEPGLSVREPAVGTNGAKFALDFLKKTVAVAQAEYEKGAVKPRMLILDEAHQFIPEPAGLGFGTPGRDESIEFGTLVMQIRKYGMSIVLISQRTAVVAKSPLSQCENVIAFRSVDQTGLDYLEAIAGGDVRNQLPNLHQGEALIFGPAVSAENPVVIDVERENEAVANSGTKAAAPEDE